MESAEFGFGKYAARIVRGSIKDAHTLIDEGMDAGAGRQPGAGITNFDEWARSHRQAVTFFGLFEQSIRDIERLLKVGVDLAESMAVLMETDGRSVVSPLVLSRSLGETILRVCHLIDAKVPPARLVARMAAFQVDSVEGNLRASVAFGPTATEEGERARENIAALHRLLKDGGVELGPAKTPPFTAWVGVDGQRETVEFNATDAYKRHVPRGTWHWSLGSGITHGRGWMLPSVVGAHDDERLSTTVELYGVAADAVLELSDALCRAVSEHTGLDVDRHLKKNHQRRMGISGWLRSLPGPAVDHVEYASRGPDWVPSPPRSATSFDRIPPKN